MATLTLVQTSSGKMLLQGAGDPSHNADFSLFDLDGEGGNPFSLASGESWEIVEAIPAQEYDADDTDSFWTAQQAILRAAKATNCENPTDYEGEEDGCGECWSCKVRACEYAEVY